jgi:hypothetical protein
MLEAYVLFGAIVASLILTQLNQRLASPVLAIFNRWLRWLVFSLGAASVCTQFELIDRPFWVLLVGFVLIYFLIETGYRWLEIHALSVSPMPLFPRFAVNSSGEEWPTHPRLLTLREWLRQQGFRPLQSLKAEVGPGIYLRTSVYQDATGNLRVQITFLPQPGGGITVCHTFSSQTTEGDRIVTDNLFLPFGGFYPENWFVERHPWTRSAARLRQRHEQRVRAVQAPLVAWDLEPLGDLNQQQREVERINTELGFLLPHAEREENGKISHEGRYRVWKEVWLLNYFGIASRY